MPETAQGFIHMNEWNKCAFAEKWKEILSHLKENRIPYILNGQILTIISDFPTCLFGLFEGIEYSETIDGSQEPTKVMFTIHNEQFKLTKEEQWGKH